VIVEIAIFEAVPGQEDALAEGIKQGIEVIRPTPTCRAIRVHRGIETPSRCVLYIEWDSVEAHLDFRGGPNFPKWRSHINGLFETVKMEHFEVIRDA